MQLKVRVRFPSLAALPNETVFIRIPLLGKGGVGVVGSTTAQIYSEFDRTTPAPLLCCFAQQIAPDELGPKIRNQHSPIANLEHPCTISLINNFEARRIAKDSAEGCSKLAIGEC